MSAIIYHNPRCSKSRQAKAILEENTQDIHVIEYLKTPLNYEQLKHLLSELNLSARDLMRTGETVYKEKNLATAQLSEAQLIQVLVDNPILIERPIVKTDKGIVIGRPPALIKTIL